MRAILSFVRASVVGLSAFVVLTASLCIALSIAIAGPPTASEMASLQEAVSIISRQVGEASRRIGEDICQSEDLDALCPSDEGGTRDVAQADLAQPPPAAPSSRAVEIAEHQQSAPRSASDTDLLGGSEASVPRASPAERAAAAPRPRAERRASSRDHRRPQPRTGRRAPSPPPPPLLHAAQERAESLPAASDAEALAEISAAREMELRHPEPRQEEQPAYEARDWDEEYYEDEPQGDDPYADDPAYEEEEYPEPNPYGRW